MSRRYNPNLFRKNSTQNNIIETILGFHGRYTLHFSFIIEKEKKTMEQEVIETCVSDHQDGRLNVRPSMFSSQKAFNPYCLLLNNQPDL